MVCDHFKETCAVFMREVNEQIYIGFDDPAEATGTDEEILSEFRRVRDEIRNHFQQFYQQNIKNENTQ